MENSLLPIDLCEDIIDACYVASHPGVIARNADYVTFARCALVCSAWLPRARFNLLRRVVLMHPTHLDLLLRTLSGQPDLADLVSEIVVLSSHGYIPFADFHARQLLRNCQHLELRFSSWSAHYSPMYWLSVAQFSKIVELDISTAGLTLSNILHLVWSFSALRVLRLQQDVDAEQVSQRKELTELYGRALGASRPATTLRELRHLKLSNARILTSMPNFPPPLAFGTSVTRLKLGVTRKIGLSESMLACIAEFRRLEFLRVGGTTFGSSSRSDGHLLQHVLPILPCIRSSAFSELELYVSPWDPFFTTRRTHIDLLCNGGIKELLARTPTFRALRLSWPDADAGSEADLYDAKWWTEQIVSRIPGLRDIVSVEIDSTPGPSWWDPEPREDGVAASPTAE